MNSFEANNAGEPTLSLELILSVLRRRRAIIVLCLILGGGGAFAYSQQQTKKYTASASLVFNNAQLNQQVAGLQASTANDPQAQQGTNVRLVQLGNTAAATARRLGHGLTTKDVRDSLTIAAEANTNVVNVSATSNSPQVAAETANTYASEFVKQQQRSSGQYFSSALAVVKKQLSALSPQQRAGGGGLALQDRAQSLGILSQIQSGTVQVVQTATPPTAPSSPRVARSTILGALFGLLIGLGMAFLIERLDRRIKDPEDLERLFRLPLLGLIPESSAYPRHGPEGRVDPAPLPPSETEVFRLLWARLRYFNVDRDLRAVLVSSAAPGDGKTTVVQNLAEAAASMGSRVIVIEADLRRPKLADRLQLRRSPGLAEVLIAATPIEESVQTTPVIVRTGGQVASTRPVTVLAAGTVPPNPAELIESHAMERVLEWAMENFDLVLIDTPPLTVVPDAIPLLRHIHGVVIVSRLGKSTSDVAARLRDELTSLRAPVLGIVANGIKEHGKSGYGYGSYSEYTSPKNGDGAAVEPALPQGANS